MAPKGKNSNGKGPKKPSVPKRKTQKGKTLKKPKGKPRGISKINLDREILRKEFCEKNGPDAEIPEHMKPIIAGVAVKAKKASAALKEFREKNGPDAEVPMDIIDGFGGAPTKNMKASAALKEFREKNGPDAEVPMDIIDGFGGGSAFILLEFVSELASELVSDG